MQLLVTVTARVTYYLFTVSSAQVVVAVQHQQNPQERIQLQGLLLSVLPSQKALLCWAAGGAACPSKCWAILGSRGCSCTVPRPERCTAASLETVAQLLQLPARGYL